MKEGKKAPFYVVVVLLIAGVLCSAGASIYSARAVAAMQASAEKKTQTTEDGVKIMDQYEIVSTLPISDAYKSGDSSKLDDKQKETLDMASAVLKEIITDQMTDYEKELAVYQWMTTKLKYDTGVLTVIPQTSSGSDNPYGVLKYRNAICVGYATTFRLFLQMMNIDCMVVHNNERSHSWDLVKLDGEWYHTDVYSDQDSGNYANFNMNDELCAKGHDWDRTFFPAATGIKYNYGYQNRTSVTDVYQLPELLKQAMDSKTGYVFADFAAIDETHARIAQALLSGIQSSLSGTDQYSNLWVDWSWMSLPQGEYLLAVTISGYSQDAKKADDLPQQDKEKVSKTITRVFGVTPEWSSPQAENGDDSTMTDGSGAADAGEAMG